MAGPCSAEDHRRMRGDCCYRCGLPTRPDPLESLDNFACLKQEEVNESMHLNEAESDYLNASFVKRRGLTTVRIADEGKMIDIEDKKKGRTIQKPSFGITYVGQGNDDPYMWNLNNKTRNALLDIFGHDTSQWIGKDVEITLAGEGEYQHVTVDVVRTEQQAHPQQVQQQQPQAAPQQVQQQQPQAQPPAPATAPATAPA